MALSVNKSLAKPDKAGLPDDYSPEKGIKSIAVAEAAEKYYARAKDADGLYEAIKAKLIAQREFVLWWDTQEKDPGIIGKPGPGRGHKTL